MIGRRWLPALVVVLACVGCGVRPSGAISGLAAPAGPVYGVTLFLVRDDQLVPVLRATTTQLTPVETMTTLADGPTSAETSAGLRTQVPASVLPVTLTDDTAGTTIDVAIDPNQLSTMAVNQLVCTAMNTDSQREPIGAGHFFMTGASRTIGPLRCPLTR